MVHNNIFNILLYSLSLSLSTDYGALLTEAGDITPKYESLRNIIQELAPNSISKLSNYFKHLLTIYILATPLPPIPANMPKAGYGQLLFQLLSFINSKGDVKLNLYLKLLQTTDFIPASYQHLV